MEKTVRIRKGLDISLKGVAERRTEEIVPECYAVKPSDFVGVLPKLEVAEGDTVKAGSPLFSDKHRANLIFTSPVSGTVAEIRRGEKRKIEEIAIRSDGRFESLFFGDALSEGISRDKIMEVLTLSGLWTTIRQRPFSTVANPNDTPKAFFVSAFDTAPLAPDFNFAIRGDEKHFLKGIEMLSGLTDGKLYLNIGKECDNAVFSDCAGMKNVVLTRFEGPHPAGNVGTQINKLCPINKGETVWFCSPQDVVEMGRLFVTGYCDSRRLVAVTGPEVKAPHYVLTRRGAQIKKIVENNVTEVEKRFISGNVLTGTNIGESGFLGFYDNQISVVREGREHELFGWILPGLKKYSASMSFLSSQYPDRTFNIDTNLHGGRRAFVVSGIFEKVFPFDIYPMQLIKACLIGDIQLMEDLGIYEVAPEDFALCEFIDPSKHEIQEIIRNGLELIRKENS